LIEQQRPTSTADSPSAHLAVSRRSFLRTLGVGGAIAATAMVLESCGPGAPSASPGASSSAPGASSSAPGASSGPGASPGSASGAAAGTPAPAASNRTGSVYPTFTPTQGGPKADFPSIGSLYEDGFKDFPATPFKAWNREPPGAGGDVQALVVVTRPAVPNALEQNPAWQAINKQLNVNFQFNRPPAADYNAKLATIMAGNDLPDILCFRNGLSPVNGTPNLPAFLERGLADLTPYLGGDAAKDYPFLAALPTFAWKNTGCAYNGKLYMIPSVNASLSSGFFRNVNIYDKEIGQNYTPKNADDFKRVLQQLTRPSEGRWGISTWQNIQFNLPMYAAMFGAPNNWLVDTGGRLIKDSETAQYKEAVAYVRDLFASGVFHPDALTTADNTAAGTAFTAGKFAVMVQGYAGTWQQQWLRGLALNPPNTFMPLGPFPGHDGAKPGYYLGTGASITTGLKKASPERIQELLRILDWLAAPFGSQEDLLLTFGTSDADWKPDAAGHPIPTERSNADAAGVNWKNIVVHPAVAYAVGLPDFASATVDAEHALFPLAIEDPTLGLVSTTDSAKGVQLTQSFYDGITDIMAARRPMSDYDQLVKDWQSAGGETIRQEYQAALSAVRA
jgi:putative aldouronate transport system substrate-binding protein